MSEKLNNLDVIDVVKDEGSLSDAILNYCSGSDIEDPKTAELWDKADEVLTELAGYLYKETGVMIN